ncbi:9584_t:CDS:2 [Entrophospora sp. SA101]|nr:9584_t:CDS:2 [Entrophospora sp. SA101]
MRERKGFYEFNKEEQLKSIDKKTKSNFKKCSLTRHELLIDNQDYHTKKSVNYLPYEK